MKSPQITAQFGKADNVYRTILEHISKGDFPKGSKLPPIRKLAELFSASYSTIDAGLRFLEEKGVVRRKAGSGVYVESGPEPKTTGTQSLQPGKSRWEEIVEQIGRDISTGIFKVGESLPLKKTLRFRLGTSFKSLNKALAEAEQRGLIHKRGRIYVAGPAQARKTGLRNLAFMLPGIDASGQLLPNGTLRHDFYFTFGKELANLGISFLVRRSLNPLDVESFTAALKKDAVGLLYGIQNMRYVDLLAYGDPSTLVKEISRINRIGLPVVMFSCAPIFLRFPQFDFSGYRNIFPFGPNSDIAGELTARYLALAGHTKVAFFSYSNELWNRVRQIGTTRGIRLQESEHGTVIPFTANVDKNSIHTDRGRQRAIRDRDLKSLMRSWYHADDFAESYHTHEIQGMIHTEITAEHHRPALWPLFEKALADKSITAWIGSDQTVAEFANRFLHEKGLSAGDRISVISIGDNVRTSDQGITACNLGEERMGYLAAHCLARDIPIKKDKRGVVECPPTIIERGTVGRV